MEPIKLPYMRILDVDSFVWSIPESVERPCPPRYIIIYKIDMDIVWFK